MKSSHDYVMATFNIQPLTYVNEPAFLLIRHRLDEVMAELKRRRVQAKC